MDPWDERLRDLDQEAKLGRVRDLSLVRRDEDVSVETTGGSRVRTGTGGFFLLSGPQVNVRKAGGHPGVGDSLTGYNFASFSSWCRFDNHEQDGSRITPVEGEVSGGSLSRRGSSWGVPRPRRNVFGLAQRLRLFVHRRGKRTNGKTVLRLSKGENVYSRKVIKD